MGVMDLGTESEKDARRIQKTCLKWEEGQTSKMEILKHCLSLRKVRIGMYSLGVKAVRSLLSVTMFSKLG